MLMQRAGRWVEDCACLRSVVTPRRDEGGTRGLRLLQVVEHEDAALGRLARGGGAQVLERGTARTGEWICG